MWLDVREREPGEDILDWMAMVTAAVSVAHSMRSPDCTSRTMRDLAIPVPPGTTAIGGPRAH